MISGRIFICICERSFALKEHGRNLIKYLKNLYLKKSLVALIGILIDSIKGTNQTYYS